MTRILTVPGSFVLAVALLVLSGCGRTTGSVSPGTAKQELRLTIMGDPKSFDPIQTSEENGEVVRYLTGGVLVRVNRRTDQVEPLLAERWTVHEGGRSITFHLRKDLRFSDGSPLTARDVARTLERALDPKEASPAGEAFRSSGGSPAISVSSPLDLTVRYRSPMLNLDRLFDQLAIVPRGNSPGHYPASAGPFFIAEYKPAAFLRLARNPYFVPRPKLESIHLAIQQNRDLALSRFQQGDLHLLTNLDPDGFDRIKAWIPSAASNLGPSLGSEFLWLNQTPTPRLPEWKRALFRSAAFRHAISLSVHRDDLARVVFRGYAHPAAGPFSPANRFWFNQGLRPRAYDSAGASRFFAEAGLNLDRGVWKDAAGHPAEFSIITNAGNNTRIRMATLIQDDLKRAGIKVNVVPLDFGSLVDRIAKSFDYDACLLGFANVDIDPVEQNNVWLSSGPQHAWWPSQKTPGTPWEADIDRLMLAQSGEANRQLRKKAFDQVQQIAFDQEPVVYLVNCDFLAAVSPRVRGVEPVPVPPQLIWNIEKLSLQ